MSTVNVNLGEFFAAPGNVLVTVTSVLVNSLNVISGNTGILPGIEAERTNGFGVASFVLRTGRYRIEAVSSKAGATGLKYSVLIDVPDDNLTYEHTEILADGATTFDPAIGNGSPDATDVVAGLVKLNSAPGATPEVVYSKSEVDTLLASLGGGGGSGGLKQANTIALIRGVSSALLDAAGGAIVWNTDGLGGGIYRFKVGGAEADDGNLYLRPSDYAGAGVHQGTLEKFIG